MKSQIKSHLPKKDLEKQIETKLNLEAIERIRINQLGEEGKFVQLLIKTDSTLIPIFDTGDRGYLHGEIVSKRLDDLEIDYQFRKDPFNDDAVIPYREGKGYLVVGAGRLRFDPYKKKLTIYTNSGSAGYGIGFNAEHFDKIRPFFPKDFEIIMGRMLGNFYAG